MNKTATIALIVALAIVGVILFKKSSPKTEATLTGTVTYRERTALPSGSKVEVEIREAVRVDGPGNIIASSQITTQGENVPIPFEVHYDPSGISSSSPHSIVARILVEDQIRWATAENVSLLINGVPRQSVELVLSAVRAQTPSTPATPPTTSAINLNGTTFRLASYNNTTVPQGTNYTLTFENGRVSAKFCNGVGGEYTLSNGFIRASSMMSTLMFCSSPRDIMDIENLFGHLLGNGAALSLVGNSLVIADAQNNMTFTVFMD